MATQILLGSTTTYHSSTAMPTLRNRLAGGVDWASKWTEATVSYMKLKFLLNHIVTIQRKGLVALSDQQVAARRTWQEVNSSGALSSTRRLMEEQARAIC